MESEHRPFDSDSSNETNVEEGEVEFVSIEAFGMPFNELLPDNAADLLTLEREGCIYSRFWRSDIEEFQEYRIRLTHREVVQYVESSKAEQEFISGMNSGLSFEEALQSVTNPLIRELVRTYPHAAIRGCFASFLPTDLEKLICGQIKDRYEPLPDLRDDKSRLAIARQICTRVGRSASHMSNRTHGRPNLPIENEYDIQDLLYICLKSVFSGTTREEWTPKIGGRSKRIDFCIPDLGLVIEAKFVSESNASLIVDQLMIDIESYHSHERCSHLLAVVYDPRRLLREPDLVMRDLSVPRVKGGHFFDVEVVVVHQ